MDHYRPNPSTTVDFAKRRIALVVDDDISYRQILSEVLMESGWEVLAASTGEDALMGSTSAIPDVVVINVSLGSGMDGWTLSRLARSRWPDIGLVFIGEVFELPQQYRNLSSERILLKPFFLLDFLVALADVTPIDGVKAHQ